MKTKNKPSKSILLIGLLILFSIAWVVAFVLTGAELNLFSMITAIVSLVGIIFVQFFYEDPTEEQYILRSDIEPGEVLTFRWLESPISMANATPTVIYMVKDSKWTNVFYHAFIHDFAGKEQPVLGVEYIKKEDGLLHKK